MLQKLKRCLRGTYNSVRQLYIYFLLKRGHVQFSASVPCKTDGIPVIINRGTFIIGENVIIRSGYTNLIGGQTYSSFVIAQGATLEIQSGSGISNSSICATLSVFIGKDVFIGGGCRIYDTDFHSIQPDERLSQPDPGIRRAPVKICDKAFIGAGSIILKGVTIGRNSVIGAGSVVTKSIPDNEIWAGNPAHFIKKI